MNLLKKLFETVEVFWDFRFLLICTVCLGIGFRIDSSVTEGMLLYCLFVPLIWSVALAISKVLRPGIRSRELIAKASETSQGASIIYAANCLVLIAIGMSFVLWWAKQ